MKINDLLEKLQYKVCNNVNVDCEVKGGYASDLLSDVMGNASEGNVWITMQTHKNVVAVASLKELPVIIFSNGNNPDDDTVEAATEEGVLLLSSPKGTFEICGELFNLLD